LIVISVNGRTGVRFTSGIAKTKPYSSQDVAKSLWKKKKKKKTSDINEKIHAELLGGNT
jgi:hypothetical protein